MTIANHAFHFHPHLVRELLPSAPSEDEDAARRTIAGWLKALASRSVTATK
jgi:hypothetical protein